MKLILGTRGSELAVAQAQSIANEIEKKHPNITVELKVIKTKGDMILQKPLDKIGGKGLFVKEIESQLINGEIDFAVHSLKDMPSEQPKGLCLIYSGKREDARDVLVLSEDKGKNTFDNTIVDSKTVENKLNVISKNGVLGTGAIRRKIQINLLRPDVRFRPIRGNIITRMKKIDSESLDGAVLAYAGLNRLSLYDSRYYIFPCDEVVPAPGQGILALECRENDQKTLSILHELCDENTTRAAILERKFLEYVDGGCHTPTGAYAEVNGDDVAIYLFYASPSGDKIYKHSWRGKYVDALNKVVKFAEDAKKTVEPKKGIVYFIGAGPYDPELITLKGFNALQKADVVVYDYLSSPQLLEYVPKTCEKIYVGKKANYHVMKQELINELLLEKARDGKVVIRLKGGDPYVFGRGGEEAEVLVRNNIPFEVVNGITSAIAVPAYAGIPVTFREIARSFHVITGHDTKGYRKWNWEALSQLEGTLIFLMSMGRLKEIMNHLIEAGKDPNTPVAIIRWGTSSKQKTVIGTMADIYERSLKHGLTAPAIIIVGEVVNKRRILHQFENRPLHGKRILVTRARNQKSKFCSILSSFGAEAVEIPTIKINPRHIDKWDFHHEIETFLSSYNWLVITSANGVRSFMDGLLDYGYDSRVLYGKKIACIGTETAKTLKEYGVVCDLLPERAISDSMIIALKEKVDNDDKVLVIKGNLAPQNIKNEIGRICTVDELIVYDTLIDELSEDILSDEMLKGFDAMAFTSGSTASNLAKLLDRIDMDFPDVPCFSIGEKTTEVLKKYTENIYEAYDISIEGLADRICKEIGGIKND